MRTRHLGRREQRLMVETPRRDEEDTRLRTVSALCSTRCKPLTGAMRTMPAFPGAHVHTAWCSA